MALKQTSICYNRKKKKKEYNKLFFKATITRQTFEGSRNENAGEWDTFQLLGSLARSETQTDKAINNGKTCKLI